MLKLIRDLIDKILRIPELKGYSEKDFDKANASEIQRKIFAQKKILQILYNTYCTPFVESAGRAHENSALVEIGSGSSPLESKLPSLICTDVVFCGWLDVTCSAFSLPFKDKSIDRLFLMFVCHHLNRMDMFLEEAIRCLKENGEIVIIDPAITFFSKIYYKYIHVDDIDLDTKEAAFEGKGRLSASNVALAWIVFCRDREKFEKKYPELELVKIEYNTCLSFLLSGGLRIRQLLPDFVIASVFKIENWIIQNITKQIAVTMSLTFRKNKKD